MNYTSEIEQVYKQLLRDPFKVNIKLMLSDLLAECGKSSLSEMIAAQSGKVYEGFTGQGFIMTLADLEQIVFAPPMVNVAFIMTDGFITGVKITSQDWFGRECNNCTGIGTIPNKRRGRYSEVCPICEGSTRQNSLARYILNTYPITQVIFSDLVFVVNNVYLGGDRVTQDGWIYLSLQLSLLDEFKTPHRLARSRINNTEFNRNTISRVGLRYGRRFAFLPEIQFPPI